MSLPARAISRTAPTQMAFLMSPFSRSVTRSMTVISDAKIGSAAKNPESKR